MKRRIAPFVENMAESTTACLMTMVQGNLFALTLSHWLIASRTGLAAGTLTCAALLVARTDRRRTVPLLLGTITAVVDLLVHPGRFAGVITEAVVTGVVAGLLSFLVRAAAVRLRRRSQAPGRGPLRGLGY
jgi:hypothetical protein